MKHCNGILAPAMTHAIEPRRKAMAQAILLATLSWGAVGGATAGTFSVTTTTIGSPGDLNSAIASANSAGGSNSIVFALPAGSTINSSSALTALTAPSTLSNSGAVTVNASLPSQTQVTLSGSGLWTLAPAFTGIAGTTGTTGSGPSASGMAGTMGGNAAYGDGFQLTTTGGGMTGGAGGAGGAGNLGGTGAGGRYG